MTHIPVLSKEVIDILDLEPGQTYLDATTGAGGHMEEVYKHFGSHVNLCGIDADETAIEMAGTRLELKGAKPQLRVLNFRRIEEVPELFGIKKIYAILFDLGWNKSQFDTPSDREGRGFSFKSDEPLKMTFSINPGEDDVTAEELVNTWDEENIKIIISAYGEERFAGRIARAIVEGRESEAIKTSKQLAEIVSKSVPIWYRFGRIHPATRTFQAIRIAVNDELRALEAGLEGAFNILEKRGVLIVISFHSLEDRIVKNFFRSMKEAGKAELINKKPIMASEEEVEANPRARSAKLRALKKI